jgi:hypothetical protein
MNPYVYHYGSRMTASKKEKTNTMKTFASALIGLSLMIGTVMAQTPAASTSTSTTDTTKQPAPKVKKHKKHTTAKSTTTPAPATAATPAK